MQRSNIVQCRGNQSREARQQPDMTTTMPGDSTKTADTAKKQVKKNEKKTIEFQLPPLSIVGKKKEIDFEQIRKKVIRRGSPEGEDKKQLASILKHLKDSHAKIRVHEFVNLVSKFTCDNGEAMRKVMEDDLGSFRKLVTKVYENMTQDVSDVLVNEQIQMANYYQERYDMFNNKMLWMISEIFQMIPEFDFEKYTKEKEEYLKYVCPLPALIQREAEDIDLQKRQEAFHRLQWLKIEEDRLAEENRRLEGRLNDLKNQYKKETTEASMKSTIMENKLHDLEEEEQEKQEHLNELEGLLGKNIVRTEAYIRLEEDETIRMTKPLPREPPKKLNLRDFRKKDDWSSVTAASIEESAAKKYIDAESVRADEKKRFRRNEREFDKETSFFTDQSPIEYPEFPSACRMQEKNIQQITTTIQERRARRSPARPLDYSRTTSGCRGERCGQ